MSVQLNSAIPWTYIFLMFIMQITCCYLLALLVQTCNYVPVNGVETFSLLALDCPAGIGYRIDDSGKHLHWFLGQDCREFKGFAYTA